MTTNEERCEVAKNLREIKPSKKGHIEWWRIAQALGLVEIDHCFGWEKFKRESVNRLAYLIEPAKTGFGSLSGLCPKCGGSTYVVCDDYDWWVITCDACGAVHGFNPDNYIPYGEIERKWKQELQESAKIRS